MMTKRHVLCISTSKPINSLTPSGGGGSITLVCPTTGSILSSLRASGETSSKSALGVSSLSMFPSTLGASKTQLMMGFGGTLSKKDDTYGMLVSLRNFSSPPTITWKCRLPEAQLSAGLLVSTCGHYIVGGSQSGILYIWSAFGGNLLKTVKAHYRPITAMIFNKDDISYLITGGADGMVHVFSLMDLVENENRTVTPVRSWSAHHLEVTSLVTLDGNRVASASQDGSIILMEIFSEAILAKVQVPEGIQSLAFHEGRLFAGSQSGVIYSIDLDIYSSHQTSQMGVTVKRRRLDEETKEDRVFPDLSSSECYKAELRGHEKGVTSLAPFAAESVSFLVSGDESGSLRIWDLESRGCVRIIQPWSFSVRSPSESENSKASSSSGSSTLHPITSILVVPLDDDRNMEQSDIFAVPSSTKESKTDAASSLFTPLKRFPNQMDENNPMSSWLTVAFFRPKLTKDSFLFQTPMSPPELKPSNVTEEHSSGVVAALRQELAEARARLQKLEDMNSELKNQLEGKAA